MSDIHLLTKTDVMLMPKEQLFPILKDAFMDLLDGGNFEPEDIHAHTGLPMERCEEISYLYSLLIR